MLRATVFLIGVLILWPARAEALKIPPHNTVRTARATTVYPGQRPAHGELFYEALYVAQSFWHARHVSPCPTPVVAVAPDLDGADTPRSMSAAERTEGCAIWIREDTWRAMLDRTRLGLVTFCRVLVHGLGHTAGLPHTATGVMAPVIDFSTVAGAPITCRIWAQDVRRRP